MILYFSATGNSLAVARQLAERLNEQLMPLIEAVQQDLKNESTCVRVCPMKNIQLVDRRESKVESREAAKVANMGDHCTVCLACVHACAQQAFRTNGQDVRKERQYRHPQIHLKDLLLR